MEEATKKEIPSEVKEDLVKKWKTFLSERTETLVDGVFGLVLGLGAFSLTGFPIYGVEDALIAVSYFTLMFFLICMFWWGTSKWFAVAEYSNALMGINFFFIILLVLMPFFLRLLFIPDSVVKDAGMTLFPIITGVLLLGTLSANIVILRQKHDKPEEVVRDLKRGLFIFPIIAVFFFLSLLIPAEDATQEFLHGYFSLNISLGLLNDYPFRIAFWWFSLFLIMIFGGIVETLQKRRQKKANETHSGDWRKTLTNKSRAICDSVYGLALGLCAYSLTDYVVAGVGDIVIALSYFLLTFFLVAMFWMELYRAYAMVPFFNDTLIATNLILTFFVTLIPFSLRLAMAPEVAARNVGMTLFPVNMMAAGITSSAFIAFSLHWRNIDIPKDDVMELQRFAIAMPALALIYIASFVIPPGAAIPTQYAQLIPEPLSILKAIPFRVAVWWFSFIPVVVVMGTLEVIQEKIAHRK